MAGPDAFFDELRREYLTEAPARLAELRKDWAAARAGEADATKSLKNRFHRLAGSGGSYGFPDISAQSRAAERWLMDNLTPDAAGLDQVEGMIAGIAGSFDQAALELGLPVANSPRRSFGWRAVVLGYAGGLVDQIDSVLTGAGYTVQQTPPSTDPAAIPVSERADVAVLAGLAPDDVSDTVARWAHTSASRPPAVVLVSRPTGIDPLVVPFAYLDLIVDPERVDTDLARFVQTLGQSKTAPRTILVASADQSAVELIRAALESTGVSVVACRSSAEIRSAFDRTPPDLVVMTWNFPDTTGAAVVRWTRQLDAHKLTPIVVVSDELTDEERILAERAGADLVLPRSVSRSHLTHTLLARIERAFVARGRSHRDNLTGLLNRPTMVEELEHTIAQARRIGEPISYLALDLDHFRRINEQFGSPTGDAVLIHVARLVSSAVRSGDFVARMGGEELGVLLRRCSFDHAVKLAEKLRATIAGSPLMVDGAPISARISVGIASYPDRAGTGPDLVRAADRALTAAKAAGRDRVGV